MWEENQGGRWPAHYYPDITGVSAFDGPNPHRPQDRAQNPRDNPIPGQQQEPRYRLVHNNEQGRWRVENANNPNEKLPAYAQRDFGNVFDAKTALSRLRQDQARPAYIAQLKQRAAAPEPNSPTHRHQDDHRGAWAGRPKEPGREYRVVRASRPVKIPGIGTVPATYRLEDVKEPDRLIPHGYGGKYSKAEAERVKERLEQDQNKGGRWPEYVRAAPTVPVEVASPMGGKAARMVPTAEAEAVNRLRSAGIRCEPGARTGWDCTEASRNENLGNFSSAQAAASTLLRGEPHAERTAATSPSLAERMSAYRRSIPEDHVEIKAKRRSGLPGGHVTYKHNGYQVPADLPGLTQKEFGCKHIIAHAPRSSLQEHLHRRDQVLPDRNAGQGTLTR